MARARKAKGVDRGVKPWQILVLLVIAALGAFVSRAVRPFKDERKQARITALSTCEGERVFRNRFIAAALILAASIGAPLVSGTPAFAHPGPSASDIEYVRTALAKYDIPEKTQNALLNAYAAGERLDSESGAAPVATDVSHVDGFERTVYRYKDGSINVSKIQEPSSTGSDGVSPNAVSGCQSIAATGARAWVNCSITWDSPTYSVGFTAAYRYYLGPLYGCSIDNIAGLHYGGAGSFSSPSLQYITRSIPGGAGNYSVECRAQGTVQQSGGGVGARTVGVLLHVSPAIGGGSTSSIST